MKKRKGKRGVVKREYVTEIYGDYNTDEHLENIKFSMESGNLIEKDFLHLYRHLKTYEERKEQLEKRQYKLSEKEWENKIGPNDNINFYHNTMTINNKGEVEEWVKRKSFVEIKQLLIKRGMVFGDNPFEEYIILGDDMKTEHIFYRKK